MKRILIPFITALIVATGCSHPFEEGMTGSFPFIELKSSKTLSFPAVNPNEGEIELYTNMNITTNVTYSSSTSLGWLSNFKVTAEDNATAKIKFNVSKNEKREARNAQIVLIADNVKTNIIINVSQSAYVIDPGKENVYEGDLHLTTQDQVNNCIYTKVNGTLYIEDGDIRDLSPLLINNIRDGLAIQGCYNLYSLGNLGSIDVPVLKCDSFNWEILQSWSANADEVTIANTYSAIDTGILYKFMNTTSLSIEGCHVSRIDGNFTRLSNLRRLSLRNNDITDITQLKEMTQLEYVNLSNTPLSMAQIRYIQQFLENTAITASSLYGNTDTSVSILETDTQSVKMQISLRLYSIQGTCGIVYGEKDVPFTQCTTIDVAEAYSSGYYNFELTNLKDGTDYKAWSFIRSDADVMFLSECAEFTTVKENFYDLTFTMSYPTFTGETTAPEYSYLEAHTVTISGNSIGSSSIPMTQEGDSYKVTVPEGRNEIFILASNGINNYRYVGYKMTSDHQSAIMVVEDTSTGGFSGDYVIGGYASENVNSNVSTTVNFVRPCTRISVSIDFSDCIGRLDDITKIGLKLDNCYSNVEYQADGTTQYTGNRSYSMSKSVSGVSGTVTVVRDAYIMPSIEGEAVSCTIQLQTPDGILEKTVQLEEGLKANSITSLPLKVSINRTDGTFTIEDVEIVDGGEIEL